MDYRALLKLYMKHILDCEGIDFTECIEQFSDSPKWTQEQKEGIERIAEEVRDELFN